MANNYCTVIEVTELMPDTGFNTGDYDQLLTASIERASRAVDREVGRWDGYFYPSTADETRYFRGNDESELRIDEAVSITSIGLDESGDYTYTLLGSTDWYAHPYNRLPIKSVCMDENIGSYSYFYDAPKSVQIIGVFGYAATPPADVRMATAMLAVRYFKRGLQSFRDMGAAVETGQMQFGDVMDLEVKRILARYVQELQV